MATDPDIDDLRQMIATLAESARELSDAAHTIAETARGQSSSSTVQINAGGIPAAMALTGVGMCVILYLMLACWVILHQSESDAQQSAWISVWQDRMNESTKRSED